MFTFAPCHQASFKLQVGALSTAPEQHCTAHMCYVPQARAGMESVIAEQGQGGRNGGQGLREERGGWSRGRGGRE